MQDQEIDHIYTKYNLVFRKDLAPIREFINKQPLVTDVFRYKKDLNLDLDFLIKNKKLDKHFLKSLQNLNLISESIFKNIKTEANSKLKILATFFQAQINPRPYSYEDSNIYIPKNIFGKPESYGKNTFINQQSKSMSENKYTDIYKLTLFINDDFDGGETSFPMKNIDVKPEAFKILFHPSNKDYIYGIRPIYNGVRMTINCYYEAIKNN